MTSVCSNARLSCQHALTGDSGNCETMLSKSCLDALTSTAANTAQWLVANPSMLPLSVVCLTALTDLVLKHLVHSAT